jgi:hypothetical protein
VKSINTGKCKKFDNGGEKHKSQGKKGKDIPVTGRGGP